MGSRTAHDVQTILDAADTAHKLSKVARNAAKKAIERQDDQVCSSRRLL